MERGTRRIWHSAQKEIVEMRPFGTHTEISFSVKSENASRHLFSEGHLYVEWNCPKWTEHCTKLRDGTSFEKKWLNVFSFAQCPEDALSRDLQLFI